MKIKIIIFYIGSILLLNSCQSAKSALQGETRADRNDEFLVEKKNPLSMPPDFEELPKPLDSKNQDVVENKNQELKAKLKVNTSNSQNNLEKNKNSSLKDKIIEQINN